MRPRPSHAAESGVGEHTARESESAQCVRTGRERGELPPPSLAPEPKGSGASCFYTVSGRRQKPVNLCWIPHLVTESTEARHEHTEVSNDVIRFPSSPIACVHPQKHAHAQRLLGVLDQWLGGLSDLFQPRLLERLSFLFGPEGAGPSKPIRPNQQQIRPDVLRPSALRFSDPGRTVVPFFAETA